MVNPVPLVVDGQNPMKRIREVLGLSQVGFAQLLGLDPNAVSRWERGQGTPRFTPGQFKVLLQSLEIHGYTIKDLPDDLSPVGQ
jgi:DNA-binding transcriptional regulator YiaG